MPCGGSWERLTLTTRLVMLSVCRDWGTDGGWRGTRWRGGAWTCSGWGTSDEEASKDRWPSRPRNFRSGRAEEPPTHPGWGTSDAEASKDRWPSRLRNLRSGRAEEPPARPGWGTSDAEATKDLQPSEGSEPLTTTSLDYGRSSISNPTINFRHTLFRKKIPPLFLFRNQPHMHSDSSALPHSCLLFKDDWRHRKREMFILKYYNFWTAYLF